MKKLFILCMMSLISSYIFAQKGKVITENASKFDSVQSNLYLQGADTLETKSHARSIVKTVGDTLKSVETRVSVLEGVENVSRTIYISNNGSDSNDGTTMGTAFATLSKAFATVKPNINQGVTITMQLDSGTYNVSDVFGKLSKFNGSGTIAFNGLMRATPITVSAQSSNSLWTKINTYNGSSSFELTKSSLKGGFAGTDLATMYPIIDNTTDSIEKLRYSVQSTYIYTCKSILNSTGSNAFDYIIPVEVTFNNMQTSLGNKLIIFNNSSNISFTRCFIDNEAGFYFYAPSRSRFAYCIINCVNITLLPVSYSSIQYCYFKPFSTIVAANTARLSITSQGITAYSNYFECPHPQLANCVGVYISGGGGIGISNSFTIGAKNVSMLFRVSDAVISPQLSQSLGYCFVDSVNYLMGWFATGCRNIKAVFDATKLLTSKGIITKPITDYWSPTSLPANLYDYNTGTIVYVKGIHYPPIETKLTSTCTYNASTTIPIGSTTYNSSIEVKYSVTRGTSTYFGTFTIIPGTTPTYDNTIKSNVGDLGVSITAVQDGTTTTQTNMVVAVDNMSTNNVTLNYNVNRIMK